MRKKISIGFLSLALLLLFAGAISVYDLNRIRREARRTMEMGDQRMRLAEKMENALHSQNSSIIDMFLWGESLPDARYDEGVKQFNEVMAEARTVVGQSTEIAQLENAYSHYQAVIAQYPLARSNFSADNLIESYLQAYYSVDNAVKSFIMSSSTSISSRTSLLEENVYKTISPSILTMLIAIFLVLLLYFFIDIFYLKPLGKINKGLKGFLDAGIPFDTSIESNDELMSLRDMVDELIQRDKRNR